MEKERRVTIDNTPLKDYIKICKEVSKEAEKAVLYAEEYGCNTIAHGSTGKGNDQVRFEVTMKAKLHCRIK